MRSLLYCLLALAGIAVIWLLATRSVTLLVDRVYTVLIETPVLDHFRYDSGVLELGPKRLDLMNPAFAWDASVTLNAAGHVVLSTGGKSFALGPGRAIPNKSGLSVFDFAPDSGDTVRLTVERSALSWPTPFEMNFMTGVAPRRKRYAYCRLRWTKNGGAKLHMLWRVEQGYFRDRGWIPAQIVSVSGGLVRVATLTN